MRNFSLLLLCLACASGSPRLTPAAPPAERSAVLAATEQLFEAMRERDGTALARIIHPRAVIYSLRPETGRSSVQSATEFIDMVARADQPLQERIFDPRIEVDDGIATVWGFYDFHRGTEFSHCGTDAFQFVREQGEWRLIAATYTVRTAGCAR